MVPVGAASSTSESFKLRLLTMDFLLIPSRLDFLDFDVGAESTSSIPRLGLPLKGWKRQMLPASYFVLLPLLYRWRICISKVSHCTFFRSALQAR